MACPGAAGLTCVDLQTDRGHCGDCATVCGPGKGCAGGHCVTSTRIQYSFCISRSDQRAEIDIFYRAG